MSKRDKKYKHGPEHLVKHYHDWWERRKDFSDRMLWLDCDRSTGEKREVSEEEKKKMVTEGYQLIGEAYMLGKAFEDRWECEEQPEEYKYCTLEQIMSNAKIVTYDLYNIIEFDPVTDDYRDWMDKLLRTIFCEDTEAEKIGKLEGKVSYKP